MNKNIVIAFIVILLLSCKKDKPVYDNPYGLPNATRAGVGTFACRINGVNKSAIDGLYTQNAAIYNDTAGVSGTFNKNMSYFQILSFAATKELRINYDYDISDQSTTIFYYATDSTCFGLGPNVSFNSGVGSFRFSKLDSFNKIVSGTFSFKIPIPNCDTLNFTDGRFDISFK